ncbi:MAG: FtsP/CotA-like multicopper oxidase with cupredoxin domain [Crocinitomicaceae bacterium]|jgi:FtsP/CotA-like multicopper oxidase with cupredoxin domain
MTTNRNLIGIALFALGSLCSFQSNANIIEDTVYINRGMMMAVDSTYIPYYAFNPTSVFDKENARLFLDIGDTMELTVINTDSLTHGFDIKEYANIDTLIAPYDTAIISFNYQTEGAHIYYDHSFAEGYRYMGLGGMIIAKNPASSASRFYWNLKEHEKSYNFDLDSGYVVDWTAYYPEYFTINGNSNPHINTDVNARVVGNLNDTIHVYMVNTGQSLHSIHFHGYHSEIIQSTKFPTHVGRIKDTYAIHSMELVVLELIPDQVGEYPVHDHNLVAVSGANIYPNGMFLTILID